ncbi:HSF2 [Symbiodinium microadriaticum]|nr:HSF2 [Symbiodinium microadriaticum]
MTEIAGITQNSNFPQKLFALMEMEPADVVCWTERGLSFRVVDPEKFAEEVVPKYFRHTKMTSFQRQLNLYGFRRVTKGEDTGSYYHPKFQRGRRDFISEIKRLPGKSSLSDPKSGPGRDSLSGKGLYNITPGKVNDGYDPTRQKSLPISKVTANVNGLQGRVVSSSNSSMQPLAGVQSQSLGTAPRAHPQSNLPAHTYNGAGQFLPVATAAPLPVPGGTLTREVCDQPFLLRNFSVSSTFDEEYRLTSGEDDAVMFNGVSLSESAENAPASGGDSSSDPPGISRSISADIAGSDTMVRPDPPEREESESWVKLGVLDSMHDMEPFDIEAVFE